LSAKEPSPTPSSEPEPTVMEMNDQSSPSSTITPDARDQTPLPPTARSEDTTVLTSSPPPTSSTLIGSDVSSNLDVPTERPPTPVSTLSTTAPPSAIAETAIADCPPAEALFDNELIDRQILELATGLPEPTPTSPPPPPPAIADTAVAGCPSASALFDDELPLDMDVDRQLDELVRPSPSPPPPSPKTDLEKRETSPSPPVEPQTPPESPFSLSRPRSSSPPSPPPRSITPVPSSTVEPDPEPEPETHTEAEVERPAVAPQKVKLSLQAWKMKKQAEKQEQQRAGHAQAQAGGQGMEGGNANATVNANGGGSAQASPTSVNDVLGGGEDEQGRVMDVESNVESCKADVPMVHPSTAAATTTTTSPSIATPIAKLELNGYHGPPLLLPKTREAKQEVIERPLSGLSGLKDLISAPSTLSNTKTAPVLERSVSPMGPDLAFSSSQPHSWEDYVPLAPTKPSSHRQETSSVHRLPQEDGEIRDTLPSTTNANASSSSKPVPVPPRAPPPVVSNTEPSNPMVLPPRPNLLHAHSMARLPPRPAVALPPPLTGRGTPPGQGRRWASPIVPSSQAISPSVSMLAPSLARTKPPTAPRSMNIATGPSTPPLSSLNPNCVVPKPVLHKSPPKGPRALMESWPGGRNLSGSSTSTTAANLSTSTSPTAPTTSSLPASSASPSLPTTTTQYIPRGPSATRDLERWPNTTKELDRLMEARDRERDRERERDRDRDRDRVRDRDRDERDRYADRERERDRDRDYDQRHYRAMRRPGWR